MPNEYKDSDKNTIITTKMAYERCESYMSALRATLHIYQDTTTLKDNSVEYLQHVIALMSLEINALNTMLDDNGK